MCKRIISLVIACIMCISLGVPVFAATATKASDTTPKNVPISGYKTLKEAATAYPKAKWYGYSMLLARWYPYSESTVRKAVKTGFSTRQELVNKVYYGVDPDIQGKKQHAQWSKDEYQPVITKKGDKWSIMSFHVPHFYQYFPTVESIVKASPDAFEHSYDNYNKTWLAHGKGQTFTSSPELHDKSFDDFIAGKSDYVKGPFSSKSEAESTWRNDPRYNADYYNDPNCNGDPRYIHNKYTKKWFYNSGTIGRIIVWS